MQDRIEALEHAVAHLTRAVEDLSEITARQDGEIARLTRRMQMLLEREAEREADASGTVPLADQKPPHW
ncbi:MAG: SlyX family protein [Gemmobacter sp.]